jgi:hypothetical protein
MIAAFEQELTKIYFETCDAMYAAESLYNEQQRQEYERYRDIADGIIII